ncbi:hypothetical protein TNCT_722771 [Trichonephila clavata]|uniref:Mos1 transposase HTH domain-containing protein n=1 Tax=Trichonephila clavata TaxID=2740835 RepID=A0A8X6LZT5_TRICU|nr:hypothetical protein TNCT_722771 [Trichonephila clavata]
MSTFISSPTNCKMRFVSRILKAQKVAPIEIYRQLYEVHGVDVMSKLMAHRWYRDFNEVRQKVPSVMDGGLVEKVRQYILQNRYFMVTEIFAFPLCSVITIPYKNFLTTVTCLLHSQVTEFYDAAQQKLFPC